MSLHRDKLGGLAALSLVSGAMRVETLNRASTMKAAADLDEILAQTTAIQWAVFGLDFSFNDDRARGLDQSWQMQWAGTAFVEDIRRVSRGLGEMLRTGPAVLRPVRVTKSDISARAVSYTLKSEFVRRVAYRSTASTRAGGTRTCWNTRKVRLRPSEQVRLLTHLHGIGLMQRIVFWRLRPVISDEGVRLERHD